MGENKLDLEELERVARAATPGPWEQDCTVESDGAYGSGEDASEGYGTYAIYESANGIKLFDFLNSEAVCVEEEFDEDGKSAWDGIARRNAAFIALANPQTILALIDRIKKQREALENVKRDYEIKVDTHKSNVEYLLRTERGHTLKCDYEKGSLSIYEEKLANVVAVLSNE